VEREAIEQEVMRGGWEVDYGFSGHLIIGNAEDLSILTPLRIGEARLPSMNSTMPRGTSPAT
jgi:hypothetical protein